jgi:hypothetical protein
MALDFENLAKLAQKYVADCPVMVLGTGATIPHGLPSMARLASELLARVTVDADSPDADLWQRFAGILREKEDLEIALHEVVLSNALHANVICCTWEFICEHDVAAHDAILADPSLLPLTRLFRHMLRTAQARASVVTTNYDRLAEYASSAAGAAYFTGFAPGFFGRFAPSSTSSRDAMCFPGQQGHVHIWKVHGSLDWFRNTKGEPVCVQGTRHIPDGFQPLIVTPGTTKYRQVHQDPFRTVITNADAALENARGFLCIGYGFNDEHVQPKLLLRHRRDRVPVTVVTKALTPRAKELLLGEPGEKYLVLEESAGGTTVYMPECPAGETVDGREVWSLPGFLDMVIGERE